MPRWRIVVLMGLGLAAGNVLASWRRSDRQALRALASCLVVIVAADFVVLGYLQLPRAFSIRPILHISRARPFRTSSMSETALAMPAP